MRGVYVKDGGITEVYIGNGITQIFPEEEVKEIKTIEAFTFMPRKVQEKKKCKNGHNAMIFFSAVIPMIILCLFGATLVFYPIIFWVLFLGSFSWAGLVLYANTIYRLRRKRHD